MPSKEKLEEELKTAKAILVCDPNQLGAVSDDGRRLYTFVNGYIVQASSAIDLNKLSDREVGKLITMLRHKHLRYN